MTHHHPLSRPLYQAFVASLVVLTLTTLIAFSATAAERSSSGLALPRFVSVRGVEVNMRTGPGMQYPIDWVYRLQGLPMEIIAEYKTWRKVRDWEGAVGWVHQSMLASKRAFIIQDGPKSIRALADGAAPEIARAATGVVGELINCDVGSDWCRVSADGFDGWLKREDFWGVLSGEAVN